MAQVMVGLIKQAGLHTTITEECGMIYSHVKQYLTQNHGISSFHGFVYPEFCKEIL